MLLLEGAQIVVASTTMDELVGVDDLLDLKGEEKVLPDITVDKVDINCFDAIYIPGRKSPPN